MLYAQVAGRLSKKHPDRTNKELNTAVHMYNKFGFKLVEEKESNAFGKAVIEQKYELLVSCS